MRRVAIWVSVLVVGVSVLVGVPVPGDAVVPGGNGRIVFDSTRDGSSQIYVMDPDGSNQAMLTSGSDGGGVLPAWSPDGSKVAFQATGPKGWRDVFVMDADGKNRTNLTNNSSPGHDSEPSWSPDGSKIVFSAGSVSTDSAIVAMDADGSNWDTLVDIHNEYGDVYDSCPVWSPDGSKIAFSATPVDVGSEFFVMDADGSNLTQLPVSAGADSGNGSCLEWSPDGTRFVFGDDGSGAGYERDIYVMDVDGGNLTNLSSTATSSEDSPTWSPDGSKIAFTRDANIWSMNVDGTGQTELSNDPGSVISLDWAAVNRSPVAVDDSVVVERGGVVTVGVLGNDSDPDGDPVVISGIGTAPLRGSVAVVSGEIRYTHDGSVSMSDSFTYLIDDGALSAEATVTVTVTYSGASFTDVPIGHTFFSDVEWMAGAGITKGCNPPTNDRFCPDGVVTRGQMAAFLVRALGLTDRLDDPFTDDDGSIFEADIERLAAAGITKGCNPSEGNTKFCPDAKVTREQMAAFLVRALGYTDAGGGDLFIDDDASIFEGDIDRLATAGVTKGCNPPTNDRFCPSNSVTRGQMAAFLHRALG